MYPLISPLGDRAVRMTFGDRLTEKANDSVQAAYSRLDHAELEYISEMVPGYVTLTVYYDPLKAPAYNKMLHQLKNAAKAGQPLESDFSQKRHLILPVYYGGNKGPDLEEVARWNSLETEEVIKRHTGATYRVYMMGFAPGFPYLGELDETLATPRRKTPRKKVPSGSVGIAGPQTGVYSVDSPGGWQIIGHTPVRLFDAGKEEPVLIKAGDLISFKSVNEQEYEDIFHECEKGIYRPSIE
ncbi:5-oxoprolinase subunit PxpB [Salipaludibacillus aurantiacus]|uniref:Inhibitor of KinA n=1 Tax=Salipaludibacillus aurantiacus TaxID=1601833 RepID=A0A1H9V9E3_9BACI|nr:5-oxoprolinase subunit PxpB [Salipaludibacillus aurantiacus]SES18322.1 inhibitor of KinA [Salipaludibacillus aurantiacus]